jgi:hypothetical protein
MLGREGCLYVKTFILKSKDSRYELVLRYSADSKPYLYAYEECAPWPNEEGIYTPPLCRKRMNRGSRGIRELELHADMSAPYTVQVLGAVNRSEDPEHFRDTHYEDLHLKIQIS